MTTIGDIGLGATDQTPLKEQYLAEYRLLPPNSVPNSLRVFLVREPFDEWYTILTDNGHSEEFEDQETRAWLRARGADEDLIQNVITQTWNFYRAICIIRNPRYPQENVSPIAPKLTAM